MTRELITRDTVAVVVDENGDSHQFQIENNSLLFDASKSEEMYEWAIEQSDYSDSRTNPDDIDWPVSVTQTHHLEDTLGLRIPRELNDILGGDRGYQYFTDEMGGRPNYPSIEVIENWIVHSDGDVELETVEYDGVVYTPEKLK